MFYYIIILFLNSFLLIIIFNHSYMIIIQSNFSKIIYSFFRVWIIRNPPWFAFLFRRSEIIEYAFLSIINTTTLLSFPFWGLVSWLHIAILTHFLLIDKECPCLWSTYRSSFFADHFNLLIWAHHTRHIACMWTFTITKRTNRSW